MDQIICTQTFPSEGQTVLGKSFQKSPGGKGANQAVQAALLGADVTMLGKLGNDANGQELLETCRSFGVNTQYVRYDQEAASGCAVIIVEDRANESAQNRIVVIPGSNMRIRAQDISFLRDSIEMYDLVMLQLEIPMDINELVAQYAFEKGVPVMLNSAPSAPLSNVLLSYLSYISPNEHEAQDLTGVSISHHGNLIDMRAVKVAAENLQNKGVSNVLITLGSAGAALLTKNGFFTVSGMKDIVAIDPTAAGDSFVAAFSTGVACGWKWEDCLRFANCTASLTVCSRGAMPSLPTLEKVKDFMCSRNISIPELQMLQ